VTPRFQFEEALTEIHQLPGEKQSKPGKAGEASCARMVYCCAGFAKNIVAIVTKLAVSESINAEGKGGKTESRYPESIYRHVDQELGSEDAFFKLFID
jgi:hypothetical protein